MFQNDSLFSWAESRIIFGWGWDVPIFSQGVTLALLLSFSIPVKLLAFAFAIF
jgi:hypothetical protein